MRLLYIFDAHIRLDRFNPAHLSAKDTVYIFPLTSRPFIINTVINKIKSKGCNVRLLESARINKVSANHLREKYIKFIAQLPQRIQRKGKDLKEIFAIDQRVSLWWFSLIAEKSTHKSEAFNRLVQFHSIVNIILKEEIDGIFLGCQSGKLKSVLKSFCRGQTKKFTSLNVEHASSLKVFIKEAQGVFYLKHTVNLIIAAVRLFIRTTKIKRAVGHLKRRAIDQNRLMLITGYPYFDVKKAQEGIFKNKFYAGFDETLQKEGEDIIWVAVYAQSNSISLDESLRYARRFIENGTTIYFLEEFNSVSIQLKALFKMWINGLRFLNVEKQTSRQHTFDQYHFYPILRDDWYSSFVGSTGYGGYLYYYMFCRLFENIKVNTCLYFLEMQAWEKALIFAKKTTRSKTRVLGYQHATVPRFLLSYFNDREEITGKTAYPLPLPDKIICNGNLTMRYMQECGWPDDRVVKAEAIRYNHLKRYTQRQNGDKKNTVLIVCSISPEESSALLSMAREALKDLHDVELWLRPHPFLNLEKLFAMADIPLKDQTFKIKNEPMGELLVGVKIAIVGGSGVALEALAFGCKVIIMEVSEWLNMSPLKDIHTPLVATVSSVQELRKSLSQILKEEFDTEKNLKESAHIINDFFNLNEKTNVPHRFLELLKQGGRNEIEKSGI